MPWGDAENLQEPAAARPRGDHLVYKLPLGHLYSGMWGAEDPIKHSFRQWLPSREKIRHEPNSFGGFRVVISGSNTSCEKSVSLTGDNKTEDNEKLPIEGFRMPCRIVMDFFWSNCNGRPMVRDGLEETCWSLWHQRPME